MKMRETKKHRSRWCCFASSMILSAIVMLAGCEGSKSDTANNHSGNDPNHPELFTIPQSP